MTDKGIPCQMMRWIHVWLSNRLTWVTFDGIKSKTVTLKQGVPQRSVLSPLLFLFYINDLPATIDTPHISLFADDVAVWVHDNNLAREERRLQQLLQRIDEWSRRWKMELSPQNFGSSFFSTTLIKQNGTHPFSCRAANPLQSNSKTSQSEVRPPTHLRCSFIKRPQ